MRIATKGIFALKYEPVKHLRAPPRNGVACSAVHRTRCLSVTMPPGAGGLQPRRLFCRTVRREITPRGNAKTRNGPLMLQAATRPPLHRAAPAAAAEEPSRETPFRGISTRPIGCISGDSS